MEPEYYEKQLKVLNEATKESSEKKISWLQHILLVSSSILGIILSLHPSIPQYQHIHLVFVVSMALLLSGVLGIGYCLYVFSNLAEKARESFHKAISIAVKNKDTVKPVLVKKKKSTSVIEKISYVFLSSSLILFVVYRSLIVLLN